MSTLHKTPNPYIADNEFLLGLLRESREKFLRSFANVPDHISRVRPAQDRWSVLEIVEHLTMAETIMLGLVTTQRRPKSAATPDRAEYFLLNIASANRKVDSPESAKPTGRFANLAEAAAQFRKSRESVIGFIEQNTEDLRATEVSHPHTGVGVVSTYEMVVIMAKHAERHVPQIEQARATVAHAAAAKNQS